MATIVFCSPNCTGCELEDVVAAVREFAETYNHELVLRQMTNPVNVTYLKNHKLDKYLDSDFLLCEETSKIKLVGKRRIPTADQLQELVT